MFRWLTVQKLTKFSSLLLMKLIIVKPQSSEHIDIVTCCFKNWKFFITYVSYSCNNYHNSMEYG